ncbi:MAG: hypothetical protein KGL39_03570 [Patescibacteria group bacterium]|nr:hypothetical protein [Patescibacteria group bacterium]
MSLTFKEFQRVSQQRNGAWHNDGVRPWVLPDYGNAAAGEMGELCNYIKKLQRVRDGLRNVSDNTINDETVLKTMVGREIADVLSYLVLVCIQEGLDMESVLIDKFNAVSDRVGLSEFKLAA